MSIINILTSQLNIDESQAKGGMGVLLNLAKNKLGSGDFASVAKVFDNPAEFMDAAPSTDTGMGGLLGKAASMLGSSDSKMAQLATLATSFSKLNIDQAKITKFADIALNYIGEHGSKELKSTIEKFLK